MTINFSEITLDPPEEIIIHLPSDVEVRISTSHVLPPLVKISVRDDIRTFSAHIGVQGSDSYIRELHLAGENIGWLQETQRAKVRLDAIRARVEEEEQKK